MDKVLVDNINFGKYKIYRSNGYLGLFDAEDNQILPFLYDAFEYDKRIFESTIIFIQNGKKGVFLLSNHGQQPSRVLIPAFYDTITKEQVPKTTFGFNPCLFYCYRDTMIDIWDEGGTMIYSDVLDNVLFSIELKPDQIFLGVKRKGKCGIVSSTLRQLALPCEYDEVSEPVVGHGKKVLCDVSKNRLWGVIEMTQLPPFYKTILPIEYEELRTIGQYIAVKINGRYGIRDYDKAITECEYDTYNTYIDSCYTDTTESPVYISLSRNQDYYLFREDGLTRIPGKIKEIYSEECFVFERDGYLGIADFNGNILIRNQYTNIAHLPEDVCLGEVFEPSTFRLERNGKYGLFSLTFNKHLPCNFERIFREGDFVYCAEKGNTFSLYDSKFSCIVPFGYERYEKIEYSCDQTMSIYTFYKVFLQGKVGIYSDSGQCVPCTYDDVDIIDLTDTYRLSWLNWDDDSYNFWFVVTNNGKKGLIDEMGVVHIPCVCDDITLSDDIEFRYNGNFYSGMTLSQIEELISKNNSSFQL